MARAKHVPTTLDSRRERSHSRESKLWRVVLQRAITDAFASPGKGGATVRESAKIKANSAEFKGLAVKIEALEQEEELSRPLGRITEPDDLPLADSTYRPRAQAGPRPRARVIGGDSDRRVFASFRDVLRGSRPMATMSVGSDPDGGAMVPRQIDQRILDQLVDISPVRRIAEVVQTASSDYVKIVNKRGASSGWGNENTTRTETDTPILAEIRPPSGELWAYPSVTTWMLDDSMFNVERFIDENVSTEFAFQEGTAFVTGNGVDRPRGFTTYTTAATADASRDFGTLEHVAAASATVVTADELIELVYTLAPAYRQGAGVVWAFNSTTASEIRQLKDNQDRYLWADGLQPGQPAMLLGFPVVEMEAMPDTASGLLAIAFGNWPRGYIVTDRIGTRMIRDEVTTPGKVKFSFGKRVGGAVTDSNAIKFIKMN
jgi:HK97 family phage major capsid protein